MLILYSWQGVDFVKLYKTPNGCHHINYYHNQQKVTNGYVQHDDSENIATGICFLFSTEWVSPVGLNEPNCHLVD